MEPRSGIFEGENPVAILSRWLGEAAESEPNDANAIALATVDAEGLPNVRMVLLKEIEADGFVFYTNYESAKGRELTGSGKGAFLFHWKSLRRQIRVRGLVEREEGAQADAYYASRPLQSRLGAWASPQSKAIASRGTLLAEVAAATALHGTAPRRPPHWGGFRLRPLEMEFWADGAFRLHDRFRFRREAPGEAWSLDRLAP